MTEYQIIWLFDAGKDLNDQYKELAQELNLHKQSLGLKYDIPTEDVEPNLIIERTKETLQTLPDWLLVFDNAEPTQAIQDFLPQQLIDARGHILITSRSSAWQHTIKIKHFELKEAVAYIVKILYDKSYQVDTISLEEYPEETELAKKLYHFPLSITKATAYIKANSGYNVSDYINDYSNSRAELAKAEEDIVGSDNKNAVLPYENNYRHTERTTIKISIDKIKLSPLEKKKPKAILNLLYFIALLHANEISGDLLLNWMLENHYTKFDFNAAMVEIDKNHSLIELINTKKNSNNVIIYNIYNMHDLVQEIITTHFIPQTQKENLINKAITVVHKVAYATTNQLTDIFAGAHLLPHAKKIIDMSNDSNNDQLPSLINYIGFTMLSMGDLKGAMTYFDRLLKIPNIYHLDQIDILNNIANAKYAIADFETSLEIQEKLLELLTTDNNQNHSLDIANILYNMGNNFLELSDYNSGIYFYQKSLHIQEALLPETDLNRIITKASLACASISIDNHDFPNVVKDLHKAHEIHKSNLDKNPNSELYKSRYAKINERLGWAYIGEGDTENSDKYYKAAFTLLNEIYTGNTNNPKLASMLDALGELYLMKEELSTSKEHYKKSIAMKRILFNRPHQSLAFTLCNLAMAIITYPDSQNEINESIRYLQESKTIAAQVFTEPSGFFMEVEYGLMVGSILSDNYNAAFEHMIMMLDFLKIAFPNAEQVYKNVNILLANISCNDKLNRKCFIQTIQMVPKLLGSILGEKHSVTIMAAKIAMNIDTKINDAILVDEKRKIRNKLRAKMNSTISTHADNASVPHTNPRVEKIKNIIEKFTDTQFSPEHLSIKVNLFESFYR